MTDKPVQRHSIPMFWLVLASLLVGVLGLAGLVFWLPAGFILVDPNAVAAARAYAVYGAAGPVISLIALVIGWMRVRAGSRSAGLKWLIALPLIWMVGLLSWSYFLTTVCGGEWSCQI